MKQAAITIKYDEEKLNAITQYMEKKEANFEGELNEVMNKLWEKYVPQPVREYIDSRNGENKPTRPQPRTGGNTNRTTGITPAIRISENTEQ